MRIFADYEELLLIIDSEVLNNFETKNSSESADFNCLRILKF